MARSTFGWGMSGILWVSKREFDCQSVPSGNLTKRKMVRLFMMYRTLVVHSSGLVHPSSKWDKYCGVLSNNKTQVNWHEGLGRLKPAISGDIVDGVYGIGSTIETNMGHTPNFNIHIPSQSWASSSHCSLCSQFSAVPMGDRAKATSHQSMTYEVVGSAVRGSKNLLIKMPRVQSSRMCKVVGRISPSKLAYLASCLKKGSCMGLVCKSLNPLKRELEPGCEAGEHCLDHC